MPTLQENRIQDNHNTADFDNKQLLRALRSMAKGDFAVRMPLDHVGLVLPKCPKQRETFNKQSSITPGL